MSVSRRLRPAWAVGLVMLVLAGCAGAEGDTPTSPVASVAGVPVATELFGTHVKGIGTGSGPIPPAAGAIRLWDSGVSWRDIQPTRGAVNWTTLDHAVAQAEATGAKDIMWVHGNTPQWAAEDPESPGLYGPGTSSAPDEQAYLDILRQVATRYRGRITSYQVWNEANIKIFYRGTPDSMAALTEGAREVLRATDPDALLVGASTTIRRAGPVKPWYGKYAAALAKRGWPVDAMSVHLYPLADQGAGTRAAYIRVIRPWLAERGWTGPIWDTEVNFGDRRDFAPTHVKVPQATAAGWVARAYIDSLALGIDRVYWYSWNDHTLGIDQVDPQTGEILPAGQAYLTVQQWLIGATWQGCAGELMAPTGLPGEMTTCSLTTSDSRPGRIMYSHGAATTISMPTAARSVCRLDGTCEDVSGDTLPVGTQPMLVRF